MNRLKELREARKLTQAKLGEMMGTTAATVQRLETSNRKMTEDWARKAAASLGVDVAEIFGAIMPAAAQGLPVLGDVQAGIWREIDIVDEPKHGVIPVGPDPRYHPPSQYALLVQGTSMNKLVPHGSYVVCVQWAEVGRAPREGDIVVVERRRDGMVETTLKRIGVQNKKLVLYPESTDPRWQTAIELDGSLERDEIAVTALVIGRYEQLA